MVAKVCSKCHRAKPLEEFSRNKNVADGRSYWCKICINKGQGRSFVRGRNHGEARTPLWNVWKGMRERCHNTKATNYRWYGAQGIRVCDAWRNDYTAFRDWSLANGFEPGMQIDRENTAGNYEPSNCRWTTRLENLRNRRAFLPEELEERLQWESVRSGVPVYSLIREAIECYLDTVDREEVRQ